MKDLLEALIDASASSNERIPMKGNTITYMNPGFAEVLKDLNKEAKEMEKENLEKESKNVKTEVYRAIPKDKAVFASFICEYTFYDRDKHDPYVEFLGIFTDPEKAEKACDDCTMLGWKPITSNIISENKKFYKVKGGYFFNESLAFLTIRNRIVMLVELDKFDIKESLTFCNSIDQKVYDKLLELFKIYRSEHDKLSNVKNDIHKLFEK